MPTIATDVDIPAPFVPEARLDLASVAAPAPRIMQHLDEFFDQRHAGLVGAVVQQVLAESSDERGRKGLDARMLGTLAAELMHLRCTESHQATRAQLPADPTAIAEIAAAAGEFLRTIEQGGAARARVLLTAEGSDHVPFRLDLGGRLILGRFDRLLKKGDGYEVLAWTTGDADEEARLPLLALALFRSGRAALNEGRVIVHRVRVEGAEVKGIGFGSAALDAVAEQWQRALNG